VATTTWFEYAPQKTKIQSTNKYCTICAKLEIYLTKESPNISKFTHDTRISATCPRCSINHLRNWMGISNILYNTYDSIPQRNGKVAELDLVFAPSYPTCRGIQLRTDEIWDGDDNPSSTSFCFFFSCWRRRPSCSSSFCWCSVGRFIFADIEPYRGLLALNRSNLGARVDNGVEGVDCFGSSIAAIVTDVPFATVGAVCFH